MIEFTTGNIFDADVEALVNPVNCDGVMGAGLAKQFKEMFRDNFRAYREECDNGRVDIGRMFVYLIVTHSKLPWIINFPTKLHWKDPSKIEYIESGLYGLIQEIWIRQIKSIAIPRLGCGLGGLDWAEVKPLIVAAMEPLEDVRVVIYEGEEK